MLLFHGEHGCFGAGHLVCEIEVYRGSRGMFRAGDGERAAWLVLGMGIGVGGLGLGLAGLSGVVG